MSYRTLNWLVFFAIAIGLPLLARGRWLWFMATLLAAGCIYVGARLGGLLGIRSIVIGAADLEKRCDLVTPWLAISDDGRVTVY